MLKRAMLLSLPLFALANHGGANWVGYEILPAVPRSVAPQPTEQGMNEEIEERGHSARDAWIERMHKTAPGQDWRAIELANAEREMQRRNALSRSAQSNAGRRALTASPWREVGSANLAGRMWCATIASDGSTIYSGSDLGGLWKGDLSGSSWIPLGDNLYGGAYDVASIPGEHAGDPDVLMVRGANLYVTRNEGQSWEQPTGLVGVTSIRGIGRLLDAQHTLLVLAQTSTLGNAPALFTSVDYGRTFTKRYQHSASGNASFWVPRRGSAAASNIYMFVKGQCFASTNGGTSFNPLGIADAGAGDNVLTGSEAGSPTLYAALQNGGAWALWRSDDGGAHFVNAYTIGGFYGTLCASSISTNIVVWGDIEAHRSTDSGASFTSINSWGDYYGDMAHRLHADLFGFDVFPDPANSAGEIWFFGTDGGLYKSLDSGASVQNLCLAGLGVSQYYSTLTSRTSPSLILAGAQDQGYQRGTFAPPGSSGPTTSFGQLISGDYGHLTSSDGSHARVECTYPGFILIQDGETLPSLSTVDFPNGSSHDWLPAVVADPLDARVFYFCGDRLWKYTRQTNGTWQVTLQSAQNFATGGNYLTALAFAPSDPSRAYAVNDGGRIWYSTDHGVTWTPSSSNAPGQQYFYGNAISVHPTIPLEVSIGGSGYGTSAVVRSTNGGASFAPENQGLPQTLVYALAYATDGSGDLFAGHQTGALRWRRTTGQWENLTSLGSPITVYWSVEIVGTGIARFGTYGRGIWDDHLVAFPSWSTYGTGKTDSIGTVPYLGATGTPTWTSNDFSIEVYNGVPNKFGLMLYSSAPGQSPFHGGTLWLGPPIRRGPTFVLDLFGTASIPIPVGADMVGITRYYEAWFRDPQHPDGTRTGLSNGGCATFGQ
jgi:photosystem II stability/assembly factor-like uncharacterized protein